MSDDWVRLLRDALDDEYGRDRPRIATLATVDERGRPRARSVVCRKLTDDGATWYVSDGRSEKNAHVRANPSAEIVFWLSGRREQFRILGTMTIVDGPDRAMLWRELSDAARALFAWPPPGRPRVLDPAAFPERVGADVPPPATFELIVLEPQEVERLVLTTHPHNRRRWWRTDQGWRDAALNP